jgi:hypothetical protein
MGLLKDIWQIIIYPAIFWVLVALVVIGMAVVWYGWTNPSPSAYLQAKQFSMSGKLCSGVRS